tara:strand:- start:1102 stop:3084 length:1983 start_codon:yes stop_codon:yes gene_type:complete
MNSYEGFIHQSRYARWREEDGRRETWDETVDRYITAMANAMESKGAGVKGELHPALASASQMVKDFKVMPSMRALMSSGKALDKDHVAGYNCSYLPLDSLYAFDEAMYILMCGTGVGFSSERQYVSKLPIVGEFVGEPDAPQGVPDFELSHKVGNVIEIADSKYGWASGLRLYMHELYKGNFDTVYDLSKIRPHGAPLKSFGGRASGPQPLADLFEFIKVRLKDAHAQKRKISSIEAHDILCQVGKVVVVGGVRRSALISLSNLSDDRMRQAKSGEWYVSNSQRGLANNSVAFTEKPEFHSFLKEWQSLYESKSGERGIFNRVASQKQAARNGRRDPNHEFGTNPCSEIILRPYQFCNLTEVVVRADDTLIEMGEKVAVASFLGTLQSTLTTFVYLRDIWTVNTEEERLLGVSLTGIMDHSIFSGATQQDALPNILVGLKDIAVKTNLEWSTYLKIPQSAAITAVKPSGTVSQLVNSASGIHPRFAPFYIRRVRGDIKDPITQFMIGEGIPNELDAYNDQNVVFSFPQKAPKGAICTQDIGAMEQLRLWMIYQKHWCEHKPSITVFYNDDNFLEVGSYVYKNFDDISGISFLPYEGHSYVQAPYEEITEEKYNELLPAIPEDIDWKRLGLLESEDNTVGAQTLACAGGVCEIVDIGQKDE